ncbi:MAG: flagellar export protein FliJ [Candidatus Neomarinimicrobiota bacterium]
MARKGFQHKRLLDVKALILNIKSLALRESEDMHRNRSKRLGEIRAQKRAHLDADNPTGGHQPVSSRDLQIHTWYTEQLNEDLRRQVHKVRMAEQEVRQRRKVVEKSAKEKRTLEKLKEHQDRAARQETEREEQRQLDEIAGRQHSRGEGPEPS